MTKANHYPWLDWMRFLAAFVVVIGHSRDQLFVKYADLETHNIFITAWFMLTRLGNEAVLMFFVLSGFLVGGIAIQRINNDTFKLKDYIIDRFSRIYVPLVPALLLTFGMQYYLFGNYDLAHITASLLSLQGVITGETIPENEALWTLAYEVWFYIMIVGYASIYRGVSNNAIKWLLLGSAISISVGAIFGALKLHYLLCWLIGAVAYLTIPKKTSKSLVLLGILLCLYGSFGKQLNRGSESIDVKWLEMFIPSMEMARLIFSTGFALLIQQLVLTRPVGISAKIEKLGVPLAAFSYTLYLVHSPVIRFFKHGLGYTDMKEVNIVNISIYIGLISTSLILAAGMYYIFEKNTSKARKWLKIFSHNV